MKSDKVYVYILCTNIYLINNKERLISMILRKLHFQDALCDLLVKVILLIFNL